MQLIDLQDLALILKRSPETIKKDMRRNPAAVPPRVQIPGSRQLRWRKDTVDSWIESLATVNTPLDDEQEGGERG